MLAMLDILDIQSGLISSFAMTSWSTLQVFRIAEDYVEDSTLARGLKVKAYLEKQLKGHSKLVSLEVILHMNDNLLDYQNQNYLAMSSYPGWQQVVDNQ